MEKIKTLLSKLTCRQFAWTMVGTAILSFGIYNMLVFMFLNETKAAHLFERCESESVLQICPQNCPQKGLERVSTMQHSFVHMGQNPF